jgi:hypothetical protein
MNPLDRIRAMFGRSKPHPRGHLALEIERVRAALRRHEAEVDRMNGEWERAGATCCPGCMFGAKYTAATEQCSRTGRWLKTLLRRRGTEADMREVSYLDGVYPETARVPKRGRRRASRTK